MILQNLNRRFDNCRDCEQYVSVDKEGRCRICANRELELLQTAHRLVKENPKITRDEIAERLHVDVRRVENWQREGRIRCVALNTCCPNCGARIKGFSCPICNYQVADEMRQNASRQIHKQKRETMHTGQNIRDRYKRNRRENDQINLLSN